MTSSTCCTGQSGFTLIEVLVALGIVAIALMAGLKATGSLSRNAERQTISMLANLRRKRINPLAAAASIAGHRQQPNRMSASRAYLSG
jgi:prepilin-type N-terminal cleavage/methylation domain-containing protein